MKRHNTAICLVTHYVDRHILSKYAVLSKSCRAKYDVWLIVEDIDISQVPDIKRKCKNIKNLYIFSTNDLAELDVKTLVSNKLYPGCTNYGVIFFADKYNYDYTWYVEHDVLYTGEWVDFFDSYAGDTSGFLATQVEPHSEINADWYWWVACNGSDIDLENSWKSFNPVSRYSSAVVSTVKSWILSGKLAHYELLVPSVCVRAGLAVKSFANNCTCDTCRFRPVFSKDQCVLPNTIYHPVK